MAHLPDNSPPPSTPIARAALGYAVVLLVLWHRLLAGDILHPGANVHATTPFFAPGRDDLMRHYNNIQGDVWRQFAPYARYQYESWQDGRFPTWNPYIHCGLAFHANGQSALLFPFHWVFFLVDPDFARGPVLAVMQWMAATCLFWLLLRLGCSESGAWLGGLCWMLGSYNIRWLLWPHTNALLWLPVLLLAIDCFYQWQTRRRWAVMALAWAVLQTAGHPESQLEVGLVGACFVAVCEVHCRGGIGTRIARLFAFLMSAVVGTCAAATTLLPFVDRLMASAEFKTTLRGARSVIPFESLWVVLVPDLHGRPRAWHNYSGPWNYNEIALWIGFLPLLCGIVAFVLVFLRPSLLRVSKAAMFGIVVSLLSLCMIFHIWPIEALVHSLPILNGIKNSRLLFCLQFAGAVLAAVGLTELTSNCASRRIRWIAQSLAAIAVGLMCWLLYDTFSKDLDASMQAVMSFSELTWNHTVIRQTGGLICAIGILLLLTILARSPQSSLVKRSLIVVATIDLLWVAYDFNPAVPRDIANPQAPEQLQSIKSQAGRYRITATNDVLIPNLAMTYQFYDVRGYDYPKEERLTRLIQKLGWSTDITQIGAEDVFPELDPRLATYLDKTSVMFLYTERNQQQVSVRGDTGDPWPNIFHKSDNEGIYRNPNVYPRAWFAETFEVASADAALNILFDPDADLRERTLIESPDGVFNAKKVPSTALGHVEISDYMPEEVVLKTDSPTGGIVVLNDRMEKGWTVTVDGRPATPLAANYMFRGVVVPHGQHEIRWTYHAPGLRSGAVISSITIVMLVLVALVNPGGQRQSKPTSIE